MRSFCAAVRGMDEIGWRYTRIALMALLSIGITLLNLFVLTIIVCSVKLRKSIPNRLIASLAISDLLIGAFVLPLAIVDEFCLNKWPLSNAWCQVRFCLSLYVAISKTIRQIWLATDVLLCTASIYNLLAISFDRFMAVSWPLHYKMITRHRLTLPLISLPWLVGLTTAAFPLVKVRY